MVKSQPETRQTLLAGIAATLFLIAAYLLFDPVEAMIRRPLVDLFDLHMVANDQLMLLPFAVFMSIRLNLDLLVFAGVLAILRQRWDQFPLVGPSIPAFTMQGAVIGLAVMILAIVAIVAGGSALVSVTAQSPVSASLHGAGWLLADFVGAAGEELYGRAAVLLVAHRLFGWRGAVLVSGLTFSLMHLGNPGADWVWLLRLFVQGMLLAYAVYRTGSIWWSIGYHTGWNWASAPLFGAAGSGFLDQGHLLTFVPAGSSWITGGSVGPEGSIFAFAAVSLAFVILAMTTSKDQGAPVHHRSA